MYSAALHELLALHKADPQLKGLPLLVNMDGWVRGCVNTPQIDECWLAPPCFLLEYTSHTPQPITTNTLSG